MALLQLPAMLYFWQGKARANTLSGLHFSASVHSLACMHERTHVGHF